MAKSRTRKGSPLHITPSFELYGKSRRIVLDNLNVYLPLYILPLIFSIHAWIWTPAAGSHNQSSWWQDYSWFGSGFSSASLPSFLWYAVVGFSILWMLFVIVIGTIAQIMAQKAQLDGAEGRRPSYKECWATVKELGWRLFGLYVVTVLYILVGFLLIIPGIIMIRRYFLASYVMLDKKCSITEAMETSAAMSKPFSGYVYGVIGVMLLIGLINIIPFIGWIIAFTLGMFYSVAPALRYQELKKLS